MLSSCLSSVWLLRHATFEYARKTESRHRPHQHRTASTNPEARQNYEIPTFGQMPSLLWRTCKKNRFRELTRYSRRTQQARSAEPDACASTELENLTLSSDQAHTISYAYVIRIKFIYDAQETYSLATTSPTEKSIAVYERQKAIKPSRIDTHPK